MKTNNLKTAISKDSGYGVYKDKNTVKYYGDIWSEPITLSSKFFKTKKRSEIHDILLALLITFLASGFLTFLLFFTPVIYNANNNFAHIFKVFLYITIIYLHFPFCVILFGIKSLHNSISEDNEDYYEGMLRGANNMLINATKRLGRIPNSIEEIKDYSYLKRISPSSIVVFIFLTLNIIFALFAFNNLYQLAIVTLIVLLFFIFIEVKQSFIQRIDTKEPDDIFLEFVLNAVNETFDENNK